jgi:hypothetical protein
MVRGRHARARAVLLLVPVAVAGGLVQASARAEPAPATAQAVPTPEVTGPIPSSSGLVGRPQTDHTVDMAEYGYVEEEYFVSGLARHVDDASQVAPYTTRFIVRRPLDPARFNGTVIVEWNNVSAQHDQTPDWYWARPMVIREGFAYVVASVQRESHCCAPLSLQVADPVRYATMDHPDKTASMAPLSAGPHSFDIYSQVVQAVRRPGAVDPMGGLEVERVLAAGHSQSANHLFTYVTRVQPTAKVIDGFYIDGGGSKHYPAEPDVPVINVFEDVPAFIGFTPDDPTVSQRYRLWEVAGAAHADYWILRQQLDAPERALPGQPQRDRAWGDAEDEVAGGYGYDIEPRQLTCAGGGTMFPKRYAVSAALYRLDQWVRTGTPAPRVPRIQFDANGRVVRDALGHARGGLRLPVVDVPIVRYDAQRCGLFGTTIPLDPLALARRYPTHRQYVAAMQAATDAAVARGVLLADDAADLMRRARASAIPSYGVASPLGP